MEVHFSYISILQTQLQDYDMSALQAGGLRVGDLYLERPADTLTVAHLHKGSHCSLLAPRQIGKSSLIERAAQRMRRQGIGVACIDLNVLGTVISEEAWHQGLCEEVMDELGIPYKSLRELWDAEGHLPLTQRTVRFFSRIIQEYHTSLVVVFIDEVDIIWSLPFRSKALETLRGVANAAMKSNRLRFCFAGVVSPHLFDIGETIPIRDFTRQEITGMMPWLFQLGGKPEEWLDEIFSWTQGTPFMLQCLAIDLLRSHDMRGATGTARQQTSKVVEELLLRPMTTLAIEHAKHRLGRLPRRHQKKARLLYKDICAGCFISEDLSDPIQWELILAGIVSVCSGSQGGLLQVRNRIVRRSFSFD